MKSKRLIRFYFSADKLERALDNLIITNAFKTEIDAEECAGNIIEIIEVKKRLGELWRYLDGIISGLSERERGVLEFYGRTRISLSALDIPRRRAVRRVVMKFCRRARFTERFGEGVRLVGAYYALL